MATEEPRTRTRIRGLASAERATRAFERARDFFGRADAVDLVPRRVRDVLILFVHVIVTLVRL